MTGAERTRDELGDLMFSVVNLSRFLGHQPEEVLHESIAKFTRRFQAVEERVHAGGSPNGRLLAGGIGHQLGGREGVGDRRRLPPKSVDGYDWAGAGRPGRAPTGGMRCRC